LERHLELFHGENPVSFWFWKKEPRELFLAFDPKGSHWRVVTWNFDVKTGNTRRSTVEVVGQDSQVIHWERAKKEELLFFRNDKCLLKERSSDLGEELRALMNLSLHSTLKYSVEANYDFMVTPVSGATGIDIQNEGKALLWIQATFGTVSRALESLKNDPSLVLSGACFSGKVPESGEEVLRVMVFNLDIFFYMRPDFTLQIVVFDDKNTGHGSAKSPTFQQIIKVTKPQFYDEITRLLHLIAQAGEI
jgi:hypothetical protein